MSNQKCWLCGREGHMLIEVEGNDLCTNCRVFRPFIEKLNNLQEEFQEVSKEINDNRVADIEVHLRRAEMIFNEITGGKKTDVIFGEGE